MLYLTRDMIQAIKHNAAPHYRTNADGYSLKIPCPVMLHINGRWHRLYCGVVGNGSVCYVVINKQDYIVDYDMIREMENVQ